MPGNKAFKAVAKGGGIGFIGMASSALLQFIAGILVIRLLSKDEFGLISLGYVIVTILSMVSSLGLVNGVPRFLAKCRAIDKDYNYSSIAGAALSISLIVSIVISIMLIVGAEKLASLLSKPDLAYLVRVFSMMIPALVLIMILTAIFRGIGKVKPKIIFQDITSNLLRLIFVMAIVIIGQHYIGVIFAYVASAILTAALYFSYARKKISLKFTLKATGTKNLLIFSVNLLGLSLIALLMDKVAALMLGYFQSSEQVALYSVPLRLALMLQIPLQAMSFLYLPFATTLYESHKHNELQSLYLRVTKWTCFIAMPIFLAFFIIPEFIVVLLFGAKYVESAPVLQVLAAGFFFNTLFGLNGQTLMSFGRTREIMIATISGLCLNVLSGMLLMPTFGALGAAFSVAIGLIVSNSIMSAYLMLRYRIYPISWSYFRMILLAFSLAAGLHFVMNNMLVGMGYFWYVLFLALLFIICLISPFLAKSVDDEDIALLGAIENRLFHTRKLVTLFDVHRSSNH